MINDWFVIVLDDQIIHIREKDIESLRKYWYNDKDINGKWCRKPYFELRTSNGLTYQITNEQYSKLLGETNG